jgi:hypothetical protein
MRCIAKLKAFRRSSAATHFIALYPTEVPRANFCRESHLWVEYPSYRNIGEDVVRDRNAFMDIAEKQLEYNPGWSCSRRE